MTVRSLCPNQRLLPVILRSSLALAMRPPLHPSIALVHHSLGVAVIAARRNFLTSDPRIKRVVAPFNLAVFSHVNTPCLKFARQRKYASIATLQHSIFATGPISLWGKIMAITDAIRPFCPICGRVFRRCRHQSPEAEGGASDLRIIASSNKISWSFYSVGNAPDKRRRCLGQCPQ